MDNLKQIKLDRIVSSISMCPPPTKPSILVKIWQVLFPLDISLFKDYFKVNSNNHILSSVNASVLTCLTHQ